MHIELRSLNTIRPYASNPRHNDDAVDAVVASLKEFGFRQPLVVDSEGVIIVGHTRYKAALKLGLTQVPVHVAIELSPEQTRAYRIADNQTASLASWDEANLLDELLALDQTDLDLSCLGFSPEQLLGYLEPEPSPGLGDPDEVPEPPAEPRTRPGDLWYLGPHRLLCGDATRPECVALLLGDQTIDMVLSDPPYGVAYVGKTADALTLVLQP